MKIVTAIIKPFKLDEVREALTALGVDGITATDVKGYGRQKGQTEIYRGAEYETHFLPKVKIEIAVDAKKAPQVVEEIAAVAKTGKIGDGKIFVLNLEEAMRIRTGETGLDAL
jgi:nitrogen regulatory protein P-II 2